MGKKSKRNHHRSQTTTTTTTSRATRTNNHDDANEDDDMDPRRAPPALRTHEEETMDNLRFEDPFVEDYVIDDDDDDDNAEWDDMDDDDDDEDVPTAASANNDTENTAAAATATTTTGGWNPQPQQSWNPLTGPSLSEGEALEMDASAYKMHHALTLEWPALSFDICRDDLGEARVRFPHTMTLVVGSQAAAAAAASATSRSSSSNNNNCLTVLQISDLSKMAVETEDDILGEEYNPDTPDDNDNDESEDEEDDDEMEPILEHYSIPHTGGVNRVRVMPQRPDIVATWSDTGAVHLYSIASIRNMVSSSSSVMTAGTAATVSNGGGGGGGIPTRPFFSYTLQTEGYALDWSTVQSGHLVSADCSGAIQLWTPRPDGVFAVTPFCTTAAAASSSSSQEQCRSVEDLQWSPSEATVFSTAEAQGYVRIFDTRAANKAMLAHQIHPNVDVNVLSWNKLVHNLLATGSDDGTLAVWDLRHFSSSSPSPLARFTPHTTPITSVEWHPTDESMLATSDDVGTYIYDLSVEEDDETRTLSHTDNTNNTIPPQLLFVHCGSEQFKEIHWHPQISSCLMTTALTGFSIFIPSNL